MTFLEQEVCENCGYHFRTGAALPSPDDASLHRTMQFTLPPLARREPPAAVPALPPMLPARRQPLPVFALIATLALAALALAFFWQQRAPSISESDLSPTGIWDSALTSRSSANARLTFTFAGDGSGTFAWQEQSAGAARPLAGQSPLRWHQNAQGLLALTIAPPPAGDAVSGTIIAIFNSHAWLWRLDRPHKRLILGTLVFTERPGSGG